MHDRFTPCLWFNGQAEEAAAFYASCFPNSRVFHRTQWPASGPRPDKAGEPLMVEFELDGQAFLAFNGGMEVPHGMAISLLVNCESQAELDRLTERLTEGGRQLDCGWVADRFGVHWQLVPRRMLQLMRSSTATYERVFGALMTMQRIELAALEAAAGAA